MIDVIEEEDEVVLLSEKMGFGNNCLCRLLSVGFFRSGREEKVDV